MKCFSFLAKPNLPSAKVKHAVVSPQYPEFILELKKCGITVLTTDYCSEILPQLGYHADMLFAHIGNNEYLIEKSQTKLNNELVKIGFKSIGNDICLTQKYPDDVRLNSCIIGNNLICGKYNVHPLFFDGRRIITVPQGYAKCSVCVVDKNSLITDDESIYKACISSNIDALLVRKGSVMLDGFDYGFIGGCCGKISDDTIAFCGKLDTHADSQKIKSFLSFRNIYPLDIGTGQLNDIGSILPITEYD